MKLFFLTLKRALPGFILMAAAAGSQSGSIQLTPVRINLTDAAKVAVLTVNNTGSEESLMQVTLNKWLLNGKNFAYQQSDELVITPSTFLLAPGAQQIVRIGLRGMPPVENESAYRLLVEEVPPSASSEVTGTRLIVRHDLPIFVAPLQAAKPALDVSVVCTGDAGTVQMTNIGNVHMQLRNVALVNAAGSDVLWSWDTIDYLLPTAQMSLDVNLVKPIFVGERFLVTTLTDQGSFTANVKNDCH